MLMKAKARFSEKKCIQTTESEMVKGKSSHLGGFFMSSIASLSLLSQGLGSVLQNLCFTNAYSSICYIHIDFAQDMHFLLPLSPSAPAV